MLERVQYNGLTILLFPASMLSVYAETSGSNRASPLNYSQALAATQAEAVLDGPMFDKCDSGQPYSQQTCGEVLYRHYDLSGINIPSSFPDRGITISVLGNGTARAARGADVAAGAKVAVQLYPELVWDGEPSRVSDVDVKTRAALAIMSDGRLAFVVAQPMTMPQFARLLAQAGAVYAGYTDGGGSASMATNDYYAGSTEHRRVVTWLFAKMRESSVVTAVRASPGSSAAIALVIGGLITYAVWKRSKRPVRRVR